MATPVDPLEISQPILMLIEELTAESIQDRTTVIKKLSTVAAALGPERTRLEVLPFLSTIMYDDDEILMVIAQQLGEFSPLVGGPTHVFRLLPVLEVLAAAEEPLVRDRAVISLRIISAEHSVADLEEHFIPMVRRLASGEWFTSRSSACGLLSVCYKRVNIPIKEEIKDIYRKLCQDNIPLVRLAAAQRLVHVANVVEKHVLKSEMIEQYVIFSEHEQDTVRLAMVEAFVGLATLIDKNDVETLMLPSLKELRTDVSWKVRKALAENLFRFQKLLGPELTKTELIPGIHVLLADEVPEVRVTTVIALTKFCAGLDDKNRKSLVIFNLLPSLKTLGRDSSVSVKLSLAALTMSLSPLVGSQNTIDHLLPIVLTQLKDPNPEVRLDIIANLETLSDVIGSTEMSISVFPIMVELTKDPKYRVRLAIIEYIPIIVAELGVTFFHTHISTLFYAWLTDPVFAVREATVVVLTTLAEEFGGAWAEKKLVPQVTQLAKNESYLHRMTLLLSFSAMAAACGPQITLKTMLPTVIGMQDDKVPNVRFNVCKTLQKIASIMDKNLRMSLIKPCLEQLALDVDIDVKYFANEALDSINNLDD